MRPREVKVLGISEKNIVFKHLVEIYDCIVVWQYRHVIYGWIRDRVSVNGPVTLKMF